MLNNEDLQPLLGSKTNVYGSDGEKIGTLGQVYLDDGTDLPHFATVHTGLFGTQENFVPLSDAEISNGELYVRYTKQIVKNAPNIDPLGHLEPEEEDELYDYYSQAGLGAHEDAQEPATTATATATPDDAGDTRDTRDAEDARDRAPVGLIQETPLTAREQEQDYGGAPGRPRIRKYVVTAVESEGEAGDPRGRHEASSSHRPADDTGNGPVDGPDRHANEDVSEGSRAPTEEGPETRGPRTMKPMDP